MDETGFQARDNRPCEYPRRLEWIQQIELSSLCNLKCRYCPSPNLGRPKQNISLENFTKALELARYLQQSYEIESQDRRHIWLHGIGESLLHPQVIEMCLLARETLPTVQLLMGTNGLLITDEIAKGLQEAKVGLDITAHVSKAAYGVEIASRYGLIRSVTCSPVSAPTNWAGQVDWPNPMEGWNLPCAWLQRGWAMITSTGDIVTCCIDSDGTSKVGHVMVEESIVDCASITLKPWRLCETCHLNP